MKHILTTIIFLAAFSAGAAAQEIQTEFSEDFQKKLEDDYGEREAEYLTERLESKLRRQCDKADLDVSLIKVVIEDAKPNRPTMEQTSRKPGLDPLRSISIGGAKLTGVAYDADGTEISRLTYDWYTRNIEDSVGATTWTDASRAFDKFSRRLVRDIAD